MKEVRKALIITVFIVVSSITGCGDDAEDNGNDVENITEVETVVSIADTGQIECASGTDGNETMASCSGDTVTVAGQDGSYVDMPNARSFSGPTAHGTFTEDYITDDSVTGLVWTACTEGQELADAGCDEEATPLTFEEGTASCEVLNSLNDGTGYAGVSDWRLPTISELRTLVDYGEAEPAIDISHFPDTVATWYWTSDQHRNPGNAFCVNFESGNVLWWTKADQALVRCVSTSAEGGSEVELVWTPCSMNTVAEDPELDTTADCSDENGKGSWKDALAACENLEFAGRTDWRLPSVAELHTLIDVDQTGGVFIDQTAFPDTPGTEAYYWSSTTYDGLPFSPCTDSNSCAWYVNFNDGYVEGVKIRSQKDQENHVRCVAGP